MQNVLRQLKEERDEIRADLKVETARVHRRTDTLLVGVLVAAASSVMALLLPFIATAVAHKP